jgi:hypothetical protein
VAVAVPDALALTAGVTVTAQELGHLGFHGGLDGQTHAEAGDLLQDLAQVLPGGEPVIDLDADPFGRGESCGHGRGPPQLEWLALLGTYARPTFPPDLGRHHRRKYDANKVVERFSIRLREQIDLDALTAELVAVVDRTLEPTTVSLWLRPPSAGPRNRPARWHMGLTPPSTAASPPGQRAP